ncbi:MAG: phage holin family protein [Minisyncoccia bacterium]
MFKLILRFLIIAFALVAISQIVPGIHIAGYATALEIAVIWGIIGITIKPLIHLFALPITFLTLGLFAFIINALLFWLVAAFVPGFSIAGFLPALEGSLILAVVNWILHIFL